MKTFKKLEKGEVEFKLEIEEEDMPVQGNFMATDEPEKDKEAEDEVLARLAQGDTWAWCYVVITACWGNWKGSASLGGCSYEGEKDFRESGGYYETLCDEALAMLNMNVESDYEKLQAREENDKS